MKASVAKLLQISTWRNKNPDKCREYRKKWAENNKDRIRACCNERRKKNKEKYNARDRAKIASDPAHRLKKNRGCKNFRLKRKYGITIEEYESLITAQVGSCPICTEPLRIGGQIDVDHCHSTGRVRAILHSKCNRLLACCSEDIATLYRAINYLREHSS